MIGLLIILVLLFFILFRQAVHFFPLYDFIEYWAAARLNLSGGNPYNPNQIYAIEKGAGWLGGFPLMMWVPPWVLTLIMPLGFFEYNLSRLIWLFLGLLTFVMVANLLWQHYGGNLKQRWIALLIVVFFAPTLITLLIGQISFIMLIGIIGFLILIKHEKGFWAGVFVSLTMVKPHMLYLLLLAILLWSVHRRRFSVLIGMGTSLILATGIALAVNPDLIWQYLYAMKHYPPWLTALMSNPRAYWVSGTPGGTLRLILGHELTWLQFLPSVVGCIWLVIYWLRQKESWDWSAQFPLLSLVSSASASYGWHFDMVVITPALIQTTICLSRVKISLKLFIVIMVFVITNSLILISGLIFNYEQRFLGGLGIFYLLFFLIVRRISTPKAKGSSEHEIRSKQVTRSF